MGGITLTGSLLGSFVNGGAIFNTAVGVGLAGALGTNASTAWQMSRNVGAGGNADPIYTGGAQLIAAHSVLGMVQAATATNIPLYLRFVVPVGVALVSFVAYLTRAKEAKDGEEAPVNKLEPIYKGAMFLRDHMCTIMKVVAVAAAVLMILGGNLPMGITLLLSISMNLLIESGILQKYLSPEAYNRILWMEKFLSSVFCIFGGPVEFVTGVINLVSCFAGELILSGGEKQTALLEYGKNRTEGGLLVRNPELLLEDDLFETTAFDPKNKTQLNQTIQFNSKYVHFPTSESVGEGEDIMELQNLLETWLKDNEWCEKKHSPSEPTVKESCNHLFSAASQNDTYEAEKEGSKTTKVFSIALCAILGSAAIAGIVLLAVGAAPVVGILGAVVTAGLAVNVAALTTTIATYAALSFIAIGLIYQTIKQAKILRKMILAKQSSWDEKRAFILKSLYTFLDNVKNRKKIEGVANHGELEKELKKLLYITKETLKQATFKQLKGLDSQNEAIYAENTDTQYACCINLLSLVARGGGGSCATAKAESIRMAQKGLEGSDVRIYNDLNINILKNVEVSRRRWLEARLQQLKEMFWWLGPLLHWDSIHSTNAISVQLLPFLGDDVDPAAMADDFGKSPTMRLFAKPAVNGQEKHFWENHRDHYLDYLLADLNPSWGLDDKGAIVIGKPRISKAEIVQWWIDKFRDSRDVTIEGEEVVVAKNDQIKRRPLYIKNQERGAKALAKWKKDKKAAEQKALNSDNPLNLPKEVGAPFALKDLVIPELLEGDLDQKLIDKHVTYMDQREQWKTCFSVEGKENLRAAIEKQRAEKEEQRHKLIEKVAQAKIERERKLRDLGCSEQEFTRVFTETKESMRVSIEAKRREMTDDLESGGAINQTIQTSMRAAFEHAVESNSRLLNGSKETISELMLDLYNYSNMPNPEEQASAESMYEEEFSRLVNQLADGAAKLFKNQEKRRQTQEILTIQFNQLVSNLDQDDLSVLDDATRTQLQAEQEAGLKRAALLEEQFQSTQKAPEEIPEVVEAGRLFVAENLHKFKELAPERASSIDQQTQLTSADLEGLLEELSENYTAEACNLALEYYQATEQASISSSSAAAAAPLVAHEAKSDSSELGERKVAFRAPATVETGPATAYFKKVQAWRAEARKVYETQQEVPNPVMVNFMLLEIGVFERTKAATTPRVEQLEPESKHGSSSRPLLIETASARYPDPAFF